MALTAKMKAFAQAVVDGLSNKDAAISAGYSEKSAMQQGSKLAKIPEVIAYIDQFKSVKKLTPTTQKLTSKNKKLTPWIVGKMTILWMMKITPRMIRYSFF